MQNLLLRLAAALACGTVTFVTLSIFAVAQPITLAEDIGWPRTYESDGHEIVLYQPQPDEWQDHRVIVGKAAVAVLLKGEEQPTYGAVYLSAKTDIDMESRKVKLFEFKITRVHFPDSTKEKAKQLTTIVRNTFHGDSIFLVSLDRMLASIEAAKQKVNQVEVNLDPPPIYYSESPAILVIFLGEPQFEPVKNTKLLFAKNTNWDIFMDLNSNQYYLLNGDSWLSSNDVLKGEWQPAKAPIELYKLPQDDNWLEVRKHLAVIPKSTAPAVFVSDSPAEMLLIEGTPSLSPISETQLLYVTNTDNTIFLYPEDDHYYTLIAGRWFRAQQLKGPWSAATRDLPDEFAKIPPDHAMGEILASVPGTLDAEAAVLLASVPKKVTIQKSTATVKVAYDGVPQFVVINGTSSPVFYAVNTEYTVLNIGYDYNVCQQGVWFVATSPHGPWKVAGSVPQVVYTIPASHPTHNVTYVYVYDSTPSTVVVGYTSGYTGAYVAADVVMFGLGVWAISEIVDHHHHSHYYSYGSGAHYSYHHGGYYRSAKYYGPYGGAGRGAMYDPVSGAYQRGAYRYGPNGSAFAREAYNPHTGRYAGQVGASNAYGSWGRSVVSDGGDWARGEHRSNARGTAAGFETSRGAAGIAGRSNITGQSGYAVRDKYGDTYVGRDGNVYRNNNGNWQKATRNGWKNTNYQKPTSRNYNRSNYTSSAQRQANYTARKQQAKSNYNTRRQQAQNSYSSKKQQYQRSSNTNRQQVNSSLNRQYQGRQVGNRNASNYKSYKSSRSSGSGRSFRGGGRRR